MAVLFLVALLVAIASIAVLPLAKGGARSVLLLAAVLAAVALAYLVTNIHVV